MAKKLNWNGTEIGADGANVTYDNSAGFLDATNVQDAIDELAAGAGSGYTSPYVGKRLGCIGDSFTADGKWLKTLKAELGLYEVTNKAVSGGSWVGDSNHTDLCAFKRAQELYSAYTTAGTTPDYILVVNGVNDIGNQVALGDIDFSTVDDETYTEEADLVSHITSTYDLDTFTGGAQAALAYLAIRFPDAIIKIGWTPAGQQYMRSNISNNGWSGYEAYIDRLKQLATMYGVDYIESVNCGICPWIASNRTSYQASAGDAHPSDAGKVRIGKYMARLLLSNL